MKKPILTAAILAFMTAPSFAKDLTLEVVRAMSDDELYELAGTISPEDETRLYQQARKEFPEGALALQSAIGKFEKRNGELRSCENALRIGEKSELRALNEREPGRYFELLRITSVPTDNVLDMTLEERTIEAREVGSQTNKVVRQVRECMRKYRKKFEDR